MSGHFHRRRWRERFAILSEAVHEVLHGVQRRSPDSHHRLRFRSTDVYSGSEKEPVLPLTT